MHLLVTATVSMARSQSLFQLLAYVPRKSPILTGLNASPVARRTTSTQLVANVRSALRGRPSTLLLSSARRYSALAVSSSTARQILVFVLRKNSSNTVVCATNVRRDTLTVRRIRAVLFAARVESSMPLLRYATVLRIRLSSGIIRPASSARTPSSLTSRVELAPYVLTIRYTTSIQGFASLARPSFLSSMEITVTLALATSFGTPPLSSARIALLVRRSIPRVINANARRKVLIKFHPLSALLARHQNTSISRLRNASTVRMVRSLTSLPSDAFVPPVSLLKEILHVLPVIYPNTSTTRTRHANLVRKISYIIPHFKLASVAPPINPSLLMIVASLVRKNFTLTCRSRPVRRVRVAETT